MGVLPAVQPFRRAAPYLVAASLAASLAAAGVASASSPGGTLGVYRGAGNPGAVAEFQEWVGRDVNYALDYLARSSWADIESSWVPNQWQGSNHQLILSVPLLPDAGGTLSDGATGAYNSHFMRAAQNLVDAGHRNAVVRLGWEFNGNWYAWNIGGSGGPAVFAAYWRQVVTAMRSVPGADFKFDWCPARDGSWYGGSLIDPAAAYPGDEYVDYIGMDVYDQGWYDGWQNPARRWEHIRSKPYGLDWLREFAAAHRKPITLPEWGLAARPDGHGGGDNPYFISKMHRWISSNNVAYNLYFGFDAADGNHSLMSGQFPRGATRFRLLFGSDAVKTRTTVAAARAPSARRKARGRVKATGEARGTAGAMRGFVKVIVQRRIGHRWRQVRQTRAPLRHGGAFRKSLSSLRRGAYRVRARYVGPAPYLRSKSRYVRFSLKR